jgi:anti-anti-sigma factor
MHLHLKTEDTTATIHVSGQFDFKAHRQFRDMCEAALEEPTLRKLVVDLREVDYIDSSALGMLLVLKESADVRTVPVQLRNAAAHVKTALEVAHFGIIFEIG